jgi:hypothetical protein
VVLLNFLLRRIYLEPTGRELRKVVRERLKHQGFPSKSSKIREGANIYRFDYHGRSYALKFCGKYPHAAEANGANTTDYNRFHEAHAKFVSGLRDPLPYQLMPIRSFGHVNIVGGLGPSDIHVVHIMEYVPSAPRIVRWLFRNQIKKAKDALRENVYHIDFQGGPALQIYHLICRSVEPFGKCTFSYPHDRT